MSAEIIAVLVALLAVVVAGYSIYRSGEPLTLPGIVAAIRQATPQAREIADLAQSAVFAAEQLKKNGQLPDNNAAFNYAFAQVQDYFPDLDAATAEMFIESAVAIAKSGRAEIHFGDAESEGLIVVQE